MLIINIINNNIYINKIYYIISYIHYIKYKVYI